MIKVWKKKQTKLLKYKPLGQAKIGEADADIILFIKMCLHYLEVLYLSWVYALFFFFKFKTNPKFVRKTFCYI